jgi:hypothetical protein
VKESLAFSRPVSITNSHVFVIVGSGLKARIWLANQTTVLRKRRRIRELSQSGCGARRADHVRPICEFPRGCCSHRPANSLTLSHIRQLVQSFATLEHENEIGFPSWFCQNCAKFYTSPISNRTVTFIHR